MTSRAAPPKSSKRAGGRRPRWRRDVESTTLLAILVDCLGSDGSNEEALRARINAAGCSSLDDVFRRALRHLRQVLSMPSLTLETLRECVDPETCALTNLNPIDDDDFDHFVAFQEFLAHDLVRPRAWDVTVPVAHCPPTHPWRSQPSGAELGGPRLDTVFDGAESWLVVRGTIADVRPAQIAERADTLADQVVGLLLAVRLLERHDVDSDDTAETLRLPPPLQYRAEDDPSPADDMPHFRHDRALSGGRAAAIRGVRPRNGAAMGLIDRLNHRQPVDDPAVLIDRVMALVGSHNGRAHQLRAVAALYGRGLRYDDPRERAFYFGSALEALLLQQFADGGARHARVTTQLRMALSDGAAAVLGRSDAERAQIRKTVKTLYDERCVFAHGPRDRRHRHSDGAGDEIVRVLIERAILSDDAGH